METITYIYLDKNKTQNTEGLHLKLLSLNLNIGDFYFNNSYSHNTSFNNSLYLNSSLNSQYFHRRKVLTPFVELYVWHFVSFVVFPSSCVVLFFNLKPVPLISVRDANARCINKWNASEACRVRSGFYMRPSWHQKLTQRHIIKQNLKETKAKNSNCS